MHLSYGEQIALAAAAVVLITFALALYRSNRVARCERILRIAYLSRRTTQPRTCATVDLMRAVRGVYPDAGRPDVFMALKRLESLGWVEPRLGEDVWEFAPGTL